LVICDERATRLLSVSLGALGNWTKMDRIIRGTIVVLLLTAAAVVARLVVLSPARVAAISPGNQDFGAAPDVHISIRFENPMQLTSLSSSTVQLTRGGEKIDTRLSYNAISKTVTLDATSPLEYASKYTVRVLGGDEGVKSKYFHRELGNDLVFSFTTAQSPLVGPGGPILLVGNSDYPFSTYVPEILRAEGLNEFATVDITSLGEDDLGKYRLVILGQTPVSTDQARLFRDYVLAGGKLIAFRPDENLAKLLGIRASGEPIADAYLKIDNGNPIGAGLVNTTIQFHGPADLYSAKGGTALAWLCPTRDATMPNPAVMVRKVGDQGGEAVIFAFDLAKSVIFIRQGNPAWSGHHRDDQLLGRSNDLLLGPAKPPWVDTTKITIAQADQQQGLLVNLIEQMILPAAPLPRFWYFPGGAKSVIVMTGDDHASGGTVGRWRSYLKQPDCGGLPISASSYVYPSLSMRDKLLAPLVARGFEAALHVDIVRGPIFGNSSDPPRDWNSLEELDAIYRHQLEIFDHDYPSLPSPITNRTHGVVWTDYASQPVVEFNHGIRMDCNYYYWPPTWVNDRPGMFTGSGLPMRFANSDGKMIDVYQESTVMTDESGQSYPYFVDALLDAATGPSEAYGAFAINAHTDDAASESSDATVASARAHGVPVMSAERLLNFEDARGNSSFDSIQWDAISGRLSFNIKLAACARDLQAMVPLFDTSGRSVVSITADGAAVDFTKQLVRGIYWARFAAQPGPVVASYAGDAGTPDGISISENGQAFTAKFDRPVDPGAVVFKLLDSNGNAVIASVASNGNSATLTTRDPLRSGFAYTAVVSALDASGHLAGPMAADFVTPGPVVDAKIYRLWDGPFAPGSAQTDDDDSCEVGVQFTADTMGSITGMRFYKYAENPGPHIGRIWSGDGKMLASAVSMHETSSGWQTITFPEPVPIEGGATYVASYHCDHGHYAFTHGFFAHRGVDAGPIHAPASDCVGGGNGVFAISGRRIYNEYGHVTDFPNQTYLSTNYWVDVDFSPALAK
jgi:hypothetical protein